ncbi:MAG TPA: hypothetical protein EYQ00_09360 [Dehalococcoidia bacterium]|jgi:hypothetical protein|nr:hypothetical protein [Dehalococcoidia bacterium]
MEFKDKNARDKPWRPLAPGDMVRPNYDPENWESGTGIVLRVLTNVEVPPLIEVMWEEGLVNRTYEDELVVIREDE